MAYIIQQRRDTLDNWSRVNPVLADGEIGFITDKGVDGKQKTSLYKLGDGKHAWNDLPLFGWGGYFRNTNDAWKGSDLDTTTASQQAILDKIAEKISASEAGTNVTITEVRDALENLFNASIDTLDTKYDKIINGIDEYVDEKTGETVPAVPGIEDRLVATESEIETLLGDNTIEGSVDNRVKIAVDAAVTGILDGVSIDFDTLKEVETYIKSNDASLDEINGRIDANVTALGEHSSTLELHDTELDEQKKTIEGWDEEVENGVDEETGEPIIETVRHKGFDEKIQDVANSVTDLDAKYTNMHQIMSERDFVDIKETAGETYPEGTLFFTYKDE